MANAIKTIVATGVTSGLGFEAIKQLLAETQPYRFILGARDTSKAQSDFSGLSRGSEQHSLTVLPLQLQDLRTVKRFAQLTLEQLDSAKVNIDLLLLNAGMNKTADEPGINGSKWSEPQLVNALSQHYLIHLLRKRLTDRVVVVSSGAIRGIQDTSDLEGKLTANSGTIFQRGYEASKFVQLLNAHWWRRELKGQCEVVAVSPGLIPGTNLGRYLKDLKLPDSIMKDAKSVPEGARSILAAVTRTDLPADPEQIFLTSWGEWWPKDVYAPSLDKALQDKWSPSVEQIEKEELVD